MGGVLQLCSHSALDTERLGSALAAVLVPGDVVILTGELGSGKTAFTRGVAAGLGSLDAVTSPTFTIMRPHRTAGALLLHLDAYRLDGPDDAEDLGLLELLDDGAVAVIEWGERIAAALGPDRLEICFHWVDDDVRSLEVRPLGDRWAAAHQQLLGVLDSWSGPC